VRDLIDKAVDEHLLSDVPVASFLSGGIDSSIVTALAAQKLEKKLQTFSVGFDLAKFDETAIAQEIAGRYRTEHHRIQLSEEEVLHSVTEAVEKLDLPSVDAINTYIVSRAVAAHGVKVALSGLGGDELFGGYESFHDVPAWARRAHTLASLPGLPSAWGAVSRAFGRSRPKLAGLLRYGRSIPGAYFIRRGIFLPEELPAVLGEDMAVEGLLEADPVRAAEAAIGSDPTASDPWIAVHLMESTLYMRNQLLRDSDWASMAHSLELRVPFVDVRLRDQIAALGFEPARHAGKRAIARVAEPELPVATGSREKTGFTIPIARALANGDAPAARGGLGARRIALSVLEAFGVPVRA
jgi:asparagine synthase (glutamine-hydrolysing)